MTEIGLKTADSLISSREDHSEIIEALLSDHGSPTSKASPSPYVAISNFARKLPLLNRVVPGESEHAGLISALLEKQRTCITYKSWREVSLQLDELLGNNAWKENPKSSLYDYDLIYSSLMEMREARLAKDYKLLLYLIRTKWTRNIGNMGDIGLYRHAYVGTKKLIEEYTQECEEALEYLINGSQVDLDDRYLLGMLIQTRKNIGRTALVLSGGSTFGIFHIGVLITLIEENLLPRIISGSSSGSIMASIMCSHTNEETVELLKNISEREFRIFEINSTLDREEPTKKGNLKNTLECLSHFIKYGTFFDICGLKKTMIDFVGDLTFREAYNRTGKILNITVSPTSIHEQTRLLNYTTAPNCLIWSAVCASCSLPGVFPSTTIYEKIPKTNQIQEWNNDTSMKFVDGSMENDLPIARLSEMFNVDHIIACQVNPHVVPMLKISVTSIGGDYDNELSYKVKNLCNNVYNFVTSEVVHYLRVLNELNIYKNLSSKLISILIQNYSGDITILPDYKVIDFLKIFENPTTDFLLDFVIRGARSSWPKVTVIKNHCGVEFALDKAISLLRGRLITTASENGNTLVVPNGINKMMHNDFSALVSTPVPQNYQPRLLSNPVTPDRSVPMRKAPAIRRHNSTSNTVATTPASKHLPRKHNSISIHSPASNGVSRGKSTTALSSLPYSVASPYSRVPKSADSSSWRTEQDRIHTKLRDHMEKKGVRRARSSGNIQSSPGTRGGDENQGRILAPDRAFGNPYIEYALKSSSYKSKEPELEATEKASVNLPRISHAKSLKNSYVGLNRLKETNISKSGNNSSYNLEEFAKLQFQVQKPNEESTRNVSFRKVTALDRSTPNKTDDDSDNYRVEDFVPDSDDSDDTLHKKIEEDVFEDNDEE